MKERKMPTFIVKAQRTFYMTLEVEAETDTEAMEYAEGIDLGWTDCGNDGIDVYDAYPKGA